MTENLSWLEEENVADKDEGVSRRTFVKTGTLAAVTAAASTTAPVRIADARESEPDAPPLKDYPITHAAIRPMVHPRLDAEFNARSVVRYLRFMSPTTVDELRLGRIRYGRAIPRVPTHPAHLVVSRLNEKTLRWEPIREVDFPEDPALRGEGLTQEMTIEEMEAHFSEQLERPPYVINLGGVTASHLRVECDREHPYWPNHGECNGGPFNVPFGALDALKQALTYFAYGEQRAR